MRKQWVKKENIYYRPWYKQKLKVSLLLVFLLAILFFIYQVYSVSQIELNDGAIKSYAKFNDSAVLQQKATPPTASSKVAEKTERYIPRGIRLRDLDLYSPIVKNSTFKCFASGKELPFSKVNDNYCDCKEDGSDEPSTNACANGVFYCKFQMRHKTGRGRDVWIPSSRISDGICDCCDGSDEENILCGNTCQKNSH